MSEPWGCFKAGAVGCLVLLVVAIAIPIVFAILMMRPLNRAIETRAELETRHGAQDAYVPPLSGAPSADRIETFLGVRRALTESCEGFRSAENELAKLEAFDDRDEVSKGEVIRQAFSTTKKVMGVGPLIGRFYEARNRALADADMGLGEYTYIYVIAYGSRFTEPGDGAHLLGPEVTNQRVRSALRRMLANQLAAVETSGETATDEVGQLASEVERLESDPAAIPWQQGPPRSVTDALLPYRAELDDAYCPSTAPLELLISVKRGLAVESL